MDEESTNQNVQASLLYFFRTSVPDGEAFPALTVQTRRSTEGGSFVFAPPGGWGALALRADKGDLIGCTNRIQFDEGTGRHRVFRIPLSKTLVDDEEVLVEELFDGENSQLSAICSGLAWDSVANRIYQHPDGSSTVYRFDETGGLEEGTIAVPLGCDTLFGEEISFSRARGLAVGAENLYIACGTDPKIYRVNKNTGTVVDFFGSLNLQSADLECDPTTFGAQQKDVLWTKGSNQNSLIAVEVERGACGGPAPVLAGTLCVKPDGTPDMTDTDGDGLLDCWERPSPASALAGGQPCIDVDGDGLCDVTLCVNSGDGKGTVCANPYRKDVFLEIDWLENHKPLQTAITKVINKFDIAPVTNPVNPATGTSIAGVRLHVLQDDVLKDASGTTIPHNISNLFGNGLISFEPYTATGPGALDFDVLKQNNFGTATQRANPKALDAKRQAFRYMIFGHLIVGLGGASGAAEVHGNDGMVTLGAASSGHAVGTSDQQAGTFMHELGHLLGLRHGGGDFVGCKPNYLSVMNYTRQFPGAPLSTTQWNLTGLDYSRSKRPDLDKSNLNEQAGIGNVSGDATAFGPGSGVVRSTAGAIDWNRNTVTSNTGLTILNLNEIINSSGTLCAAEGIRPDGTSGADGMILPGYNDWANLKYDVRSSLDFADGSRLSLQDKEAELGFEAPPDNPCTADSCPVALTETDEGVVDSDGDGVPDLHDNCPTIANPLQNNVCDETAVSIDIRPLKYPNTVKLDSPFPLAVAILGAPGFDATQVRPETVRLAQASVIRIGLLHLCARLDINRDGFLDFVCVVDKQDLVLPSDDAVAVLTAKTRAGVSIRGEDSIHIIRGTSHHDDD